jgi:hypothetical protein
MACPGNNTLLHVASAIAEVQSAGCATQVEVFGDSIPPGTAPFGVSILKVNNKSPGREPLLVVSQVEVLGDDLEVVPVDDTDFGTGKPRLLARVDTLSSNWPSAAHSYRIKRPVRTVNR